MRAARKAKAAGQVIEAPSDAAVDGCRDLGEDFVDSAVPGARGELGIREALKAAGRARGASHVRYAGHVTIRESGAQREHGHFYDCTTPADASSASALAGAPSALPAATSESGGSAPAVPASPPAGTSAALATRAVSARVAGDASHSAVMAAISGHLELVPVGTLHTKANMQPAEADIATALGVSGNLEAILPPYVAIGLNPGAVLGLKGGGGMTSATQLDLRARMRVGHVAAEGFGEYGYVTAGGSWILTPDDGETSAGFSLGIGAGVTRRVDRLSFVTFELGFQAGFQNVTVHDADTELSSRLFHVGVGFGRYLP